MSELLAIGISHKTAPVEMRERLALTDARAVELLRDLHGVPEIQEVVALSTCNRTELYLIVDDPLEAESTVLGMLARQASIQPTALAPSIYSHRNCEAARHLYRVSAGLESMIVGEDQIQGQVRRAYDGALGHETTGAFTNHLFKAALATGKRVRSETAIGAGQMSLPAVSAMLAKEVLGELRGRRVVIIGTGESSELAARALADAGGELMFVATRRRARAISLAARFDARSLAFDELPEALIDAEMVVAATSSPHLLIEAEELAEVQAQRGGRPLLIIDLAVPRDVDAACAQVRGVSLFDVDDLEGVVARNRRVRQSEARRAEGIVEEEIQSFATWLGSLEVRPTLAALRSHATEIVGQVLSENDGKWESASDQDLERVQAIARAVVNRLLHQPTLRIKELRDDRVHARMALIQDLFGLSVDDGEALREAPVEAEDLAEIRKLPERRR
ncbi:MAG: glutamyl-tRNA reductase [Acidobacteriota bacterium]|nr:glutamyl-tRNA reductase [Acidobacteriota bacterium]